MPTSSADNFEATRCCVRVITASYSTMSATDTSSVNRCSNAATNNRRDAPASLRGKDEMIKASNDLQDLRRRIYVKAKAETTWRFWGLYVHVCKMETLRAAYG
jgi:hypothetical protein